MKIKDTPEGRKTLKAYRKARKARNKTASKSRKRNRRG